MIINYRRITLKGEIIFYGGLWQGHLKLEQIRKE